MRSLLINGHFFSFRYSFVFPNANTNRANSIEFAYLVYIPLFCCIFTCGSYYKISALLQLWLGTETRQTPYFSFGE